MGNVTIRDLRQKWPDVEKRLETEGVLVVTRDGKAVATLTRSARIDREPPQTTTAEAHMKKLRAISGHKPASIVDDALADARADRFSRGRVR